MLVADTSSRLMMPAGIRRQQTLKFVHLQLNMFIVNLKPCEKHVPASNQHSRQEARKLELADVVERHQADLLPAIFSETMSCATRTLLLGPSGKMPTHCFRML